MPRATAANKGRHAHERLATRCCQQPGVRPDHVGVLPPRSLRLAALATATAVRVHPRRDPHRGCGGQAWPPPAQNWPAKWETSWPSPTGGGVPGGGRGDAERRGGGGGAPRRRRGAAGGGRGGEARRRRGGAGAERRGGEEGRRGGAAAGRRGGGAMRRRRVAAAESRGGG